MHKYTSDTISLSHSQSDSEKQGHMGVRAETHTHMDTNTNRWAPMYLRRDITGCKTRSTGGQDQVKLLLIAPVHQRLL